MIYLDNAATSRFKPKSVVDTLIADVKNSANCGRSGHKASIATTLAVEDARNYYNSLKEAIVNSDGNDTSDTSPTFKVMEECVHAPNFVISSGCDIPPMSPWANIEAFFAAVSEFYNK